MYYMAAIWWHTSLSGLVIYSAASSLVDDANPGLYAPVTGVFAAAMALSRAFGLLWPDRLKHFYEAIIAIGTFWTAYLWMVAETNSKPLRPDFPEPIPVLIFLLIGYGVVMLPLIWLWEWCRGRRQ